LVPLCQRFGLLREVFLSLFSRKHSLAVPPNNHEIVTFLQIAVLPAPFFVYLSLFPFPSLYCNRPLLFCRQYSFLFLIGSPVPSLTRYIASPPFAMLTGLSPLHRGKTPQSVSALSVFFLPLFGRSATVLSFSVNIYSEPPPRQPLLPWSSIPATLRVVFSPQVLRYAYRPFSSLLMMASAFQASPFFLNGAPCRPVIPICYHSPPKIDCGTPPFFLPSPPPPPILGIAPSPSTSTCILLDCHAGQVSLLLPILVGAPPPAFPPKSPALNRILFPCEPTSCAVFCLCYSFPHSHSLRFSTRWFFFPLFHLSHV